MLVVAFYQNGMTFRPTGRRLIGGDGERDKSQEIHHIALPDPAHWAKKVAGRLPLSDRPLLS
jgi:hypothetical protein